MTCDTSPKNDTYSFKRWCGLGRVEHTKNMCVLYTIIGLVGVRLGSCQNTGKPVELMKVKNGFTNHKNGIDYVSHLPSGKLK